MINGNEKFYRQISSRRARLLFGLPVPVKFLIKALEQMPEDTMMFGAMQDFSSMGFAIGFESKDFAEVKEGEHCPTMNISINGVTGVVSVTMPHNATHFMKELRDL